MDGETAKDIAKKENTKSASVEDLNKQLAAVVANTGAGLQVVNIGDQRTSDITVTAIYPLVSATRPGGPVTQACVQVLGSTSLRPERS